MAISGWPPSGVTTSESGYGWPSSMWTRSIGTDALPSFRRNLSPCRATDLSAPPQVESVAENPLPESTTVSSGASGAGATSVGTPAAGDAPDAPAGFSAWAAGAGALEDTGGFGAGFGGFGAKNDDHRNITAIEMTKARRKRRESLPNGYLFRVTSGTGSIPPGWKGWQRPSRFTASQLPRRAPWRSSAWTA